MVFDHELCLWLKSKKTHLDTCVEAAQSDRKILLGVDVINTGRSAGIILTGCNYSEHSPESYFSLSDKYHSVLYWCLIAGSYYASISLRIIAPPKQSLKKHN